MQETNKNNSIIDNNNHQSIEPTSLINKNKSIFKILFFISPFILICVVVISILLINKNKQSIEKNIVNKTQTEALTQTTNQILPEEDWLISSIRGTPDQILVEDPKILSYKPSSNITVSVIQFNVLNYVEKAPSLASYSEECDYAINQDPNSPEDNQDKSYIKRDENYYNILLSKYNAEDKGYIYEFKYTGESQELYSWLVAIIPNNIGYTVYKDFQNDFLQCAAGGFYPQSISKNYLLFTSSCGTGFNDGSDRPIGCDIAEEIIKPTLKLN